MKEKLGKMKDRLMKRRAYPVGICILSNQVFITKLKDAAGPLEIEKSIQIDMPPETMDNGLIVDTRKFSQTLKKAFTDHHIRSRRVAACLADAGLVMNVAEMPHMPRKEMREALKGEIDFFMLSGEDVVVDYYALDEDRVFLVAIKKNTASALLNATEKAGLDLVGIDAASLAALRVLSQDGLDLSSAQATILILSGEKNTDIGIVQNGVPTYSRRFESIEAPELAREIKATMAYWEEQYADIPIEKLIFLGDSIDFSSLREELPELSGLLEQGNPPGLSGRSFMLSRSVSAGLSMRSGRRDYAFDVNLLPPEKLIKTRQKRQILISGVGILSAILLFFLISQTFAYVINAYERKLEPIKEKLAESQDLIVEKDQIYEAGMAMIGNLKKKEAIVRQSEPVPWPDILGDITRSMPKEIGLTEISSDKTGEVILRGKSLTQEAVYTYADALTLSDYFQKSKLALMQNEEREKDAVFQFKITCLLERDHEDKTRERKTH